MCESLIDEFDPLCASTLSSEGYGDITYPHPVSMARSSLDASSTKPPSNSYLMPISIIRPCHSDSNLSVLSTETSQNIQPAFSQDVFIEKLKHGSAGTKYTLNNLFNLHCQEFSTDIPQNSTKKMFYQTVELDTEIQRVHDDGKVCIFNWVCQLHHVRSDISGSIFSD